MQDRLQTSRTSCRSEPRLCKRWSGMSVTRWRGLSKTWIPAQKSEDQCQVENVAHSCSQLSAAWPWSLGPCCSGQWGPESCWPRESLLQESVYLRRQPPGALPASGAPGKACSFPPVPTFCFVGSSPHHTATSSGTSVQCLIGEHILNVILIGFSPVSLPDGMVELSGRKVCVLQIVFSKYI